jgi:glycosyltransferase involved in cell wall biosynthesis
VGYGPEEREIKALSEDLKIIDRIKLLINPANISAILSDCDIYLSTSLFEGLSNSIMEAMAAGLPVVATDVGDNRYLVRDGYNGFIIPLKDINMIVEKLELLAESEDLRNDFGGKSRLIINNNFTQEKLLDNYLNLFAEFQHN